MSNNNNVDRELGWNDPIEHDGPDFITLPDGDYNFEITGMERARHDGSDKLPPCNKAIISVKIECEEGTTTIKHNLFLHTKTEGILCAFFTAIGQRKHGEKQNMNWNKVVGSKGRCKVIVDKWTDKNGDEKTNNKITKFYEPDDSKNNATPTKKFEAGRF
jgi:hypothetical protein